MFAMYKIDSLYKIYQHYQIRVSPLNIFEEIWGEINKYQAFWGSFEEKNRK